MTSRYQQLGHIIENIKPKVILEVGTWTGERAIQMCEHALQFQKKVVYIGVDLFETATDETDVQELNVKARATRQETCERLLVLNQKYPGRVHPQIYMGDSKFVLPAVLPEILKEHGEIDLAFIDGGHSVETMRSDIENLKCAKVCVVDDYYKPDEEGRMPDISKFGANAILHETPEKLFNEWKWLAAEDPVKDGGKVMMVCRGWQPRAKLEIKTKNCVPDEEIQKNVAYTVSKGVRFVEACAPHDLRAVIVSAGPSLTREVGGGPFIDQVKDWLNDPNARVFCVKHSHDTLLQRGLVPYGCLLLDPRSHVQDFIEQPDPLVRYFASSMVHPSTIDRLIEKNANFWVYHALVGAGEQELLKQHGKHMLIGGGSTAATRGMSVLHALGFRRFTCISFDSCYWEKPDLTKKLPDGNPEYYKVNVNGRDFYSDGQLLAQAQDFDRLLREAHFYDIDVVGDGAIPHIHRTMKHSVKSYIDQFEKPAPKCIDIKVKSVGMASHAF